MLAQWNCAVLKVTSLKQSFGVIHLVPAPPKSQHLTEAVPDSVAVWVGQGSPRPRLPILRKNIGSY